ncbi:RND transporter [Synergistales bacterium]|nr:RND transporter [Synergistales bacterium]
MKKIFFLGLIVALTYGAWSVFFGDAPSFYELRTERADRGDITSVVGAGGKLDSVSVVDVGTQVSGTIQEIFVDYNSPVKAGQTIARLDTSVLRSQLIEARATLVVAEAGVGSAGASLVDSERKYARAKELFARKLVAKSELEDAETTVLLRRAQVQEAKARVVQASAAIERAETNLGYTNITSPIDGVVVSRQVDVGQTVAASFQTPTLFRIAQDLTRMRINADVDESDIGRVAEGQEVDFGVDAFPEENFRGRVAQVRIAPSTTDGVVTYTVVIHVDNPDLRLKPGMTANVSIKTDRRVDVLRVPSAALRFSPPKDLLESLSFDMEPTDTPSLSFGHVWLVSDKALSQKIQLRIGVTDGSRVEILSGDVSAGDELATAAIAPPSGRKRNLLF